MVLRTFGAFDNEAFVVVDSPRGSLIGNPIINNSGTPVGTVFEYSDGFPFQTITLDDTDDADIFDDDDESDHVITDGGTLVTNGTEVESESYHIVRQLNEFGQAIGPAIQLTVFSQNGQTSNIWGMATDTPLVDGARYVKIDGSNQGSSLYDTFVPCFTEGALMVTDRGEVPVEALRPGDRVVTRDSGFQEVRWIGSCTVDALRLAREPSLRPVLVQAGALGDGIPQRDTYFSPNHKVLLCQPEVSLHFGDSEVFAAAKDLTSRQGFTRAKVPSVTYVHVMFDCHEALISNGMWTESFLPGKVAMRGLGRAQRGEIQALFPELLVEGAEGSIAPARRVAKPVELSAAG